jgi:thioredoxin reductase (NADPH)
MAKTAHAKVIIIGSGPAGYTAAIYAARAMLQPLLIQGLQAGGQLTITTDVENYPGFAEAIQGPWLMQQMQQQAEHVGTRVVTDLVAKAALSRRPFRLEGDGGDVYLADALIIATGAQARWLDLPAEQKFKGYGVSACATCDGFFYRGKEVIVVGGGNSGGGVVPYQLCDEGNDRASAPKLSRREGPAATAFQKPEGRRLVGYRAR